MLSHISFLFDDKMEEEEVKEIFNWLVKKEKPLRFVGQKRKNSWKSWKKKVKDIVVKKKNDNEVISIKNSIFLREKNGRMKIIVRKNELEKLWEELHCGKEKGGHQGVNGMENRISRSYIIPKLREWIVQKVKDCKICEQVRKKRVVPPSAAFLAKDKSKIWQIDYIGKFPNDAKTGDW